MKIFILLLMTTFSLKGFTEVSTPALTGEPPHDVSKPQVEDSEGTIVPATEKQLNSVKKPYANKKKKFVKPSH